MFIMSKFSHIHQSIESKKYKSGKVTFLIDDKLVNVKEAPK